MKRVPAEPAACQSEVLHETAIYKLLYGRPVVGDPPAGPVNLTNSFELPGCNDCSGEPSASSSSSGSLSPSLVDRTRPSCGLRPTPTTASESGVSA